MVDLKAFGSAVLMESLLASVWKVCEMVQN
jgi:hypothetical protein